MILRPRILRLCTLLGAAALAPALPAHGALSQITANRGEIVDFCVTSANVVFAATQGGGVYKSANQGGTWARSSVAVTYVHDLGCRTGEAVGSETVYAATSAGVWKTTSGGTTWSQVYPNEAHAVSVDPTNSSNVLVGVRGLGVLSSTNGGSTWTLGTGLDSTEVTSIAHNSNGSIAYVSLNSNTTTFWGGVFRSTVTAGVPAAWAAVNGGLGNFQKFVRHVTVDASNTVLAAMDYAVGSGGIYQLPQGGNTWTQVGTSAPFGGGAVATSTWVIRTVHADKGTAGRYWAGTGPFSSGFWRADSLGGGFYYATQTSSSFLVTNAFATFPGSPNVLLVALAGLGVYKSTNSGAALSGGVPTIPLTHSSSGIAADRVAAFTPAPSFTSAIYMGMINGGVHKSTNAGISWAQANGGFETVLGATAQLDSTFSVTDIGVSQADANEVFAGVLGRGIYRTTNGGTTWIPVDETGMNALNNSPVASAIPAPGWPSRNIRPRSIVTAGGGVTFYSIFEMPDNDADTSNDHAGVYRRVAGAWTRVVQPTWPGNSGASKFVIGGTRFYAMVNELLPYRSTDGITFTQIQAANAPDVGFARLYFHDIAANPSTSGATTTLVALTNKGLYRSTDDGLNWAAVSTTGSTSTNFATLGYTSTGTLFAGTRGGQVFCSTNNGTTFTLKTVPLTWAGSPVVGFSRTGVTIYLLTDGNGVWQESNPTCP